MDDGLIRSTLYERVLRDFENGTRESLPEFLQEFLHPVYAFLRAHGKAHSEASSGVCSFVRRQLGADEQVAADVEGRLRCHLFSAASRFHEQGCPIGDEPETEAVTFDFEWSLNRWEEISQAALPALEVFDQEWSAAVFRRVRHAVERDYVRHGKAREFRLLSRGLEAVGRRVSHPELAHMLRIREPQVKQKLQQLSQRFRHALHNHIAETVAESELATEISFVSERFGR